MNRLIAARLFHFLARLGLGGGVREMPMRLAGLYVYGAKEPDDFTLLNSSSDEVGWNDFYAKLKAWDWPKGVTTDRLPLLGSPQYDAIGFHENALVLGIHPTAFGCNGSIAQVLRYGITKPFAKRHLRTSDLITVERWSSGKKVNAIELEQAVILDEEMGHFGHWLFEQLPQLRVLLNLSDVVIIYNGMDRWKRQLLIDFGWSEDRLIPHMGEEVYNVKQLWTTNAGNFNSKDLGWLRSKGWDSFGEDFNSPRRIYVSRQNVGSRMVANFHEILPVLRDFNFQVIQPEKLGVEGSVRTFRNAEFILGPEGSGMRNMVWAKQAKVVEIFGHEVNFGQWTLAYALGFDFLPYVEEREPPDTKLRWRDLDIKGIPVDPNKLRQFLSRHLG